MSAFDWLRINNKNGFRLANRFTQPEFFKFFRDDTHMTSMKIVQFSRPPPPLVQLRAKFFHPLDLARPISNEPTPPPPSCPNDNQSVKRKHNPRIGCLLLCCA